VPEIPASAITGQIVKSQISSVNAIAIEGLIDKNQIGSVSAGVIAGLIDKSQIGSVDAAAIDGLVTKDQIASVDADTIEGEITKDHIASVDAATIEGEFSDAMKAEIASAAITDSSIPFSALVPSCLAQESATPTAYTPDPSGMSVVGGSNIALPVGKTAIIFASMSVRRVLGTFDLFLVVNGARYRDIAVNVHGNEFDPRTHFTGFYVENLDDTMPTDYALGIQVQGDGASAVVDGYSFLIMWFGGAD
jgi:hypothetical protein